MAAGLVAAALDDFVDAGFAGLGATLFVSLHSANPSTTGANEVAASGGPANGYARKQVTLAASSAGVKANSAALTFGPASAEWSIWYYGLWTAATGGTFLGYWTLRDNADALLLAAETVAVAASAVFSIGELTFTVVNTTEA